MSFPDPRRRGTRIAAGLLAAGLLGGLALQACGSNGSSSSSDTTTADGATTTTVVNTTSLDEVMVEGDVGSKPTVTFDPSYVGTEDSSKVVIEGDGPVVTADQLVTFDFTTVNGADGSEIQTSYGSSQPSPSVLMSDQQVLPVVAQALVGQPVGSRVIAATDKASQSGDWTLFVFDIKAATTPLAGPEGDAAQPPAGLPTVTVDNGVPSITVPGGDAPTDLIVQPLIKGNGTVVTAGQTIVANYVGVIYASGTVFDSAFERGTPIVTPIGAGQVIPGWDEGLVGQTVGSRVLLVVPPDKGYGSAGSSQAGISGTDTLVFVVDILAAG